MGVHLSVRVLLMFFLGSVSSRRNTLNGTLLCACVSVYMPIPTKQQYFLKSLAFFFCKVCQCNLANLNINGFFFYISKLSLLHWESLMHSLTGHGVVCSLSPCSFPLSHAVPSHPKRQSPATPSSFEGFSSPWLLLCRRTCTWHVPAAHNELSLKGLINSRAQQVCLHCLFSLSWICQDRLDYCQGHSIGCEWRKRYLADFFRTDCKKARMELKLSVQWQIKSASRSQRGCLSELLTQDTHPLSGGGCCSACRGKVSWQDSCGRNKEEIQEQQGERHSGATVLVSGRDVRVFLWQREQPWARGILLLAQWHCECCSRGWGAPEASRELSSCVAEAQLLLRNEENLKKEAWVTWSYFVLTMGEMTEGRFLVRGNIFYESDCWNRDSSLHGLCVWELVLLFSPRLGPSSWSNKMHCLYKSSSLRSSCLPQNS